MLPPTADWDVITRYLAGETSEEESREVELWEASSAANRRQMAHLRKIWSVAGNPGTAPETNEDAAWEKINRKISIQPETTRLAPAPQTKDYRWVWKVAAGLVIILGTVLVLFRNKTDLQNPGLAFVKYETPAGKRAKISLPDGSTVWLNGGSSLRYPKQFAANSREVQLQGEAFFEVAKDASKPFRISAGETITEVKGTSFNVDATARQEEIIVSVVTGKVELREEENPGNRVLLTPNQTGRFNATAHKVTSETTSDLNFMAWQTGILRFQNAELETVAHDLEKFYGKKIIFRNEQLKNCHLTSTFDHQSLEEVLEVLHLTLSLDFSSEKDTVYVDGAGC
jgi:transmembrane sensor